MRAAAGMGGDGLTPLEMGGIEGLSRPERSDGGRSGLGERERGVSCRRKERGVGRGGLKAPPPPERGGDWGVGMDTCAAVAAAS